MKLKVYQLCTIVGPAKWRAEVEGPWDKSHNPVGDGKSEAEAAWAALSAALSAALRVCDNVREFVEQQATVFRIRELEDRVKELQAQVGTEKWTWKEMFYALVYELTGDSTGIPQDVTRAGRIIGDPTLSKTTLADLRSALITQGVFVLEDIERRGK